MYTLQQCQERIQQAIDQLDFSGKEPIELYEPIGYTLKNGGKRLRPVIVLMGCNVFNDDVEPAIPAAMAVEIFHNFTLLHDDVLDNADIRRGKPTVHKKWNNNIAILSGDAMMIKSYALLSQVNDTVLAEVLKIFNSTALEICEGQQYDMNFENRNNVTIPEYIRMIELKTSVLVACAIKMGALIGGAKPAQANKLYEFGRKLGIAFQLQDDLLDTYADAAKFGKRTGGDIVANKKTYLLITALEESRGQQRNELLDLLENEKNEDIKITRVVSIFNQLNIKERTMQKIKEFSDDAFNELDSLDVPKSRKEGLYAFANQLLQRQH